MLPHALNPNVRAALARCVGRVIDYVDDGLGALEFVAMAKLDKVRCTYRTSHMIKTVASVRAAVHRSFRHEHAERARLLHLWAHLDSASPAARLLRALAEIEQSRHSRARGPRPQFAADLERVGSTHLDVLAHGDAYGDEIATAARALQEATTPLLGGYAAHILHTTYRLGEAIR